MQQLRAGVSLDAQAILALLLCFSFNMLGRGLSDSYAVFLLPLTREFGWSRAELMGAYSISLLVFAGAAPFAGALLDRFGHRALYVLGLVCLSVSLLGASAAQSLWHLYVCLGAVGGIALASLGMIPAAALLRRWFAGRLSTAMGVAYTGLGCGVLFIVPAAQWLISHGGWRSAYRTLGIAVAGLALVVTMLPWERILRGRYLAPVNPMTNARQSLRNELLQAISRPVFWGLASVFLFTSIAMYMVMIQIVAYLVSTGVPPLEAATSFGIIGALSVVGMITSGWLAGRFGFRLTGVMSYAITLAGIGLLILLRHSYSLVALSAFIVLFGISQGSRGPLIATLSTRLFHGRTAGMLFGIIVACGGLGGALGSWVSGLLFDLTGAYEMSFALAAACLLCAAVPFVTFPEFRSR